MMKYPFVHDELEVKQNFLNVAREFAASNDPEKQFAAALIYANLADYLGTHLYESLKLACHNATRTFFNGAIVLNMKDEASLPMGRVIGGLEIFSFPSKELIVPLLKNIKKNRDKVMHGLLKVPSKTLVNDIDDTFRELCEDVEQLVIYIDDIYRSLPPKTVLESLSDQDKIDDPNAQENVSPKQHSKADSKKKK